MYICIYMNIHVHTSRDDEAIATRASSDKGLIIHECSLTKWTACNDYKLDF